MGHEPIEQFLPHVYRLAVYMLRDHHAAQDIAQQTMLRALNHADKVRALQAPKVWMLRVAANLCRDHVRRLANSVRHPAKLTNDPEASTPEPWFAMIQQENCRRLELAVQSLPPRECSVLYLSAFEQLSHAQIADVLQINTGSVKVALTRARRSIREALQNELKREGQR